MIREAVEQDIPSLSDLTVEGRRNAYRSMIDIHARERFDALTTLERCKNIITERMHQQGALCLAYEQSGKVAGFILGNILEKRIMFLFVSHNQVGKGIGSALLREFLDANPDTYFKIEVVKNNTKAIDLYKKFGFQEIGNKGKLYFGLEKIEMQRE